MALEKYPVKHQYWVKHTNPIIMRFNPQSVILSMYLWMLFSCILLSRHVNWLLLYMYSHVFNYLTI